MRAAERHFAGCRAGAEFTDLKGTPIDLYADYDFAKDDGTPAVFTSSSSAMSPIACSTCRRS